MSMAFGLAQVEISTAPLALAVAAACVISALTGVFVPSRINGPRRIAADETSLSFLGIAGIALATWCLAASTFLPVYNALFPQQSYPATLTNMPQMGKILLNIWIDSLVLIAMIAGVLLYRGRKGFVLMGLSLSRIPRAFAGGIISLLVILPTVLLVNVLTDNMWYALHKTVPAAHDMLLALGNADQPWQRFAIIFAVSLLAPIAEEMFFRGTIQNLFRYTLGSPWGATLLSAAIFAVVHDWWSQPPIFFLGICLGYVYERTGNLWTCFFIHALFNTASMSVYWWEIHRH